MNCCLGVGNCSSKAGELLLQHSLPENENSLPLSASATLATASLLLLVLYEDRGFPLAVSLVSVGRWDRQ